MTSILWLVSQPGGLDIIFSHNVTVHIATRKGRVLKVTLQLLQLATPGGGVQHALQRGVHGGVIHWLQREML